MRFLKAILFLIALCLLCSIGYGQSTPNWGNANAVQVNPGGASLLKWIVIPDDTTNMTSTLTRKNYQLAAKNGVLYLRDTALGYWNPIVSASGLTLQEVTDNGNTTTNSIIIDNSNVDFTTGVKTNDGDATLNIQNGKGILSDANPLVSIGYLDTLSGTATKNAVNIVPIVTKTTSTQAMINVQGAFQPTSGTADYIGYRFHPIIDQTGGASGESAGILIDPTLTSAADFRALWINTITGKGIWQTGSEVQNTITGHVTLEDDEIKLTGIGNGDLSDSTLVINNGTVVKAEPLANIINDSIDNIDLQRVLDNGNRASGDTLILDYGNVRAYKGFFGDTGTISTVNPSVPNRAKIAAATDSTNFLSALRGIYAYTYGSRTTTPSGISLYSIDALAAVRSTNTQNWTIGIHPNIVGYNAIVYAETGATGTSGYASCFSGTLAAQNGTSSTHTFDIAAGFTMDYGSAKYNHTYGVHLFQCDRGAISNAYILGTAGISHTPPANKTLFIYDTTGYQSAIVNGGVFSIGNSFNYGNGSLFQLTGRGYIQGLLKYAGDSSANYDARTLIDKGYADATYAPISGSANYEVPLTFSTGLTRTTNTITNNLSTGVAGGQTVYGGTATGDDLTIRGTINGSPSGANVLINTAGGGDLALGSTTTHLSSVSAARTFTISNAAERSIIEYNRPSDAIADNDAIGQFDWWEGSATPRQVAAIVGFASGTNEDAGKLAFYTRESGGSTTARMIINHLGNIGMGMGISNPSAFLNVRGTSEQLRLDYDASNYLSTTISSTGNATLNLTASSGTPRFTFSDDVISTKYYVSTLNTPPATAASTGTQGEIRFGTDGYLYLCTATNTWVRVQLSTW